MGTKRFETISDCGRHGAEVRVSCRRCGRARTFSPMVLRMMIGSHMRNDSFAAVSEALFCGRCGAKGPDVRPQGWKGPR